MALVIYVINKETVHRCVTEEGLNSQLQSRCRADISGKVSLEFDSHLVKCEIRRLASHPRILLKMKIPRFHS